MDQMTLSVVVPTYNRVNGLRVVLDVLLEDPGAAEVVVVDDGSTDETPDFLAATARDSSKVRVVRTEGVGTAAARQLGVESSTGTIVLILDDDVVPSPELASGHLARHRAALQDGRPAALLVVGYMPTDVPTAPVPGGFATRFYASEYQAHVDRWVRGELDVLTTLWAGNFSLPRWLCLEVGMVSADFPPTNHQDREFGLRLEKHGVTAVFDSALRAVHTHNRPLDAFLRDSFRQGVGRWHLHRLHGDALGEPDEMVADLSPFARWLVKACDRGSVRRPVVSALRMAIRLSGRAHRYGLEERLAKLARRIVVRQGFQSAARGEGPGARPG